MKYIVMECHKGYAVLIDEESRFFNAANLNYEVGQTVTEPVLMMNDKKSSSHISFIITRVAAAAACVALLSAVGISYYSKNFKTASTVLISSETGIKMGVNKKGKVIYLTSSTDSGKQILKEYSGKGKDKLTVANEILEIEIEKGIIESGDIVDVYISADDSDEYNNCKSDFENGISDIKVNVQKYKKSDNDNKVATNAPVSPAEPIKPDMDKSAPKKEVAPPAPVIPNGEVPRKPDEAIKPDSENMPPIPPEDAEIAPPPPQNPKQLVPENDNNGITPPKPDENAELTPPPELPKIVPPVRPAPPAIEPPLAEPEQPLIDVQINESLLLDPLNEIEVNIQPRISEQPL